MAQQFFNSCAQWTKQQRVASLQRRRQWPVFSAHVKIAFTKNDRAETIDVHRIQRRSSRKTHFDRFSSLLMHTAETGGQCCGVVRYDEIVRTQKLDKRTARNVNQISLSNQLPEVLRPVDAGLLFQRQS